MSDGNGKDHYSNVKFEYILSPSQLIQMIALPINGTQISRPIETDYER